ncbi:unnamed protein product, partial [Ectocarpus sp. 12 AP-2014]
WDRLHGIVRVGAPLLYSTAQTGWRGRPRENSSSAGHTSRLAITCAPRNHLTEKAKAHDPSPLFSSLCCQKWSPRRCLISHPCQGVVRAAHLRVVCRDASEKGMYR